MNVPFPEYPYRPPQPKDFETYRQTFDHACQKIEQKLQGRGKLQNGYFHVEIDTLYLQAVLLRNNQLVLYRYAKDTQGISEDEQEMHTLSEEGAYFLMPARNGELLRRDYHYHLWEKEGELIFQRRQLSPQLQTIGQSRPSPTTDQPTKKGTKINTQLHLLIITALIILITLLITVMK